MVWSEERERREWRGRGGGRGGVSEERGGEEINGIMSKKMWRDKQVIFCSYHAP